MYCLRSKLLACRGALHIQHRLLLSGQTQLSNLGRASRVISSYLHKYPNISRKFISTETVNTEKPTASSKFGRKVVIVSSLIIGATTVFAILNHKHAEAENNKQESKKFPSSLKRGGPKNLLVADHLIDEDDSDINKPRLVILGSGWGVGDSVS